jgi:TRAP-type C4-dicarboxylate transport system substrate-binding protein
MVRPVLTSVHSRRATLGLAASLAAAPAFAQGQQNRSIVEGPRVTWNVSLWGTRRAQSEGIEAMAAIVRERTAGRFTIRNHYAEALSPIRDNIDGAMIGAFEMAHVASSFHPDKVPTLNVFDLPFLPLSDLRVQARAMRAYLAHPAVQADLARWQVIGLLPVLLPAYEMQGRRTPPRTVADFAGMRVRAPGGLGAVLRTFGATPVSVSSSDMYVAMQQGIVDAMVLPHYSAVAFRTFEMSDWFTTNLGLGTLGVVTVVNQAAWNALPPQYRQLLNDTIDEAIEIQIAAYDGAQRTAVERMRSRGLTEVVFPQPEIARLVAAARPVWNTWIADMNRRNYPAEELLQVVLNAAGTG